METEGVLPLFWGLLPTFPFESSGVLAAARELALPLAAAAETALAGAGSRDMLTRPATEVAAVFCAYLVRRLTRGEATFFTVLFLLEAAAAPRGPNLEPGTGGRAASESVGWWTTPALISVF